ncbi:MAG: hypothetical protein ABS46_15605 [Cytophagaceae bacterium SCN 52-12]|nr:MAG: hypothetical protein ABS46_15605 [Cytophagaceae bacterium SCN 52-12]
MHTISDYSENNLSVQTFNGNFKSITPREWEVIIYISEGLTSTQIARKLFIEPKSVENYRSRIAKKLNMRGRNNLIRFCWINKMHLERLKNFIC